MARQVIWLLSIVALLESAAGGAAAQGLPQHL